MSYRYDSADMVTHAGAAGGTYGLYSENYSYSSGNLYNKGGVTNTYGDPDHPHAVTERSNGNTYVYDDNGNQTRREIGSDTYDLKYDAESRLVEVKKNSTVLANFTYDGGGKQVKSIINGVTTYYVGQYYQKEGTVVTKYYYAGAERVAMRQGGVLYYIFGDHLGSTAVVKNTQGNKTELRYTAWGTTRYEYGTTPTDRRFTGQREEASLGLYFYNARWYDPAMGRFIQADTIVPGAGNPQAWDRYAYTNNNPVKYGDPTGHKACDDIDSNGNCITEPLEKKRSQPPQPPVGPGKGGEENCRGLECINSYRNNGDTQSSANAADTPPPPYEMTDSEKIGMGVTVAMTVVFIILPFEAALVYATFNVAIACGAGAAPACVAAIPLVAADVAVADFGISLTVYAAESISSGQKGQFEWIIIPSIVDMFKPKE